MNRFLMKRLLIFFVMSAAVTSVLLASISLAFPVRVGGQAAKDGTPFAKFENPVSADAELAVQSNDGMIIVNVNAVNAKNEPVPGSSPAVFCCKAKPKRTSTKRWMGRSPLPEFTS